MAAPTVGTDLGTTKGNAMPLHRLVRVGLSGLLLLGTATGAVVTGAGTAGASTSDGTLTVEVLRDFLGTGVINATTDVPQRGMKVDVADASGHHVTGTTDATGKVVVAPSSKLTGGRYRVDVSVPSPYSDYLQAAPASTAANHFDSFTSFVDLTGGKDASVITGVWDAADYTLPDSRYFVPVQNGAGGTDTQALVSFGTTARGTCPTDSSCPTTLDTQSEVGTTYGLAYDRYRGRLFQSSFARRYAPYGPDGGNAIYTVPVDGGSAQLFAKVPGAAVTPHDSSNMIKDAGFTQAPGKESIGGLALSEDGSTLYAVNLLTRTLVSFDATGSTAGAPEATVPIPDPGCAGAGDWRPFALAVHDNALYVGGVCDAESSQQRSDLKAVVDTYDGKRFSTVLTQPLGAERGKVFVGVQTDASTHWNPWNTDLASWDQRAASGTTFIDPQPELSGLAFANDGSMVLGFRDRFMDVLSAKGLDPRPLNNTAEFGMSGGDIDMACADGSGGYAWEGTGDCPDHATAANDDNEDSGVVEYFPGDYFAGGHQETALGAVAHIAREQSVVSTEFDPATHVETAGTGYYDLTTGLGPGNDTTANAYQFVGQEENGFGKAGGLGDIAYAAANAPIQIGNVVWYDGDHNGIQDAGQVLLPGATVNLLDAHGKQVATTTTDADGEYYFGGADADYQLTPGAKYTVEFDVCTADTSDVPGTPGAAELRFTLPKAGADRAHDSNVVPPTSGKLCDGTAPVTAPAKAGGVDHTIDAGVYVPSKTPPPTSPPPTSSAPTSAPTTGPAPSNPAQQASGSGTLADTGLSGVAEILAVVALLVGSGAVFAYVSRKRRITH